MADPRDLSATQLANLVHDGRLDPTDIIDAFIDTIDARESDVQAFAWFSSDQARFAARSAKEGPLQGLPIGVKDVLDTEDMPSEYGSPIWEGWQPHADCAAVAWAREAGAIVMGKTVTTEFATRKPGPTANPANLNHTPGGSSSGSAAGVAAGFFPLAFGTQTAGSIIRPAAFCGVVGYKPSFGTISRIGMKIMSDSLDTVGVLARHVGDCALFASAVSGRDLGNPDQDTGAAPRIGICRGPTWYAAGEETQALFDAAATALAKAGARVTTDSRHAASTKAFRSSSDVRVREKLRHGVPKSTARASVVVVVVVIMACGVWRCEGLHFSAQVKPRGASCRGLRRATSQMW